MLNKLFRMVALAILMVMPAAAYAKDITQIQVVSTSTNNQTQAPVTFGHVFAPTDVKSNEYLIARLIDGTNVPLQVDKKATHADNSLRHAILTVRVPSISAGATETIILSSTTTPPSVSNLITIDNLRTSGFDFSVALNINGTVYKSSVKDLLNSGQVKQWLSGELVSEWLISGPIRDANNNEHPHLIAYYHVRAYGTAPVNSVRVNVIIENAWSYQANPQNYSYSITMKMSGMSDVTRSIEHYHHARWNEYFWWGAAPELDVKHDRNYLLDSGAVTNYDRSIIVSENYLANKMLTNWKPMEKGSVSAYMPAPGAHDGIGPLPRWTAAYLISQDLRAKKATMLNGQASGSYPLHYRDKNTGKPVSIDDHPRAGTKWTLGDFPALTGSMSGKNPSNSDPGSALTVDTAHHPDLAYIPYLVSGDYYFMEELQFWANYCMLREAYPAYKRNFSEGLIISSQLRGEGWCLRTMGEAAYITPDQDTMKAYFSEKLDNNINNYDRIYTNGENIDERWNVFGVFKHTGYSDSMNNTRPWMDDFVTWAVGHLVEMGFNEAKPLRAWKAQYPVGRMTKMCYVEAINYRVEVGTNRPDVFFSSWNEFYEVNYGSRSKSGVGFFRDKACGSQAMADWKKAASTDVGSYNGKWTPGMMSGRAYSTDSYYANAQPAMAIARDSGIQNSDIAWNLFVGKNTDPNYPVPGSPLKPDYSSAPQWAVVPRDTAVKQTGPSISISASPGVVVSGDKTVLRWNTLNADSCTAAGGWTGIKAVAGSEEIGSVTSSTAFYLKCTGATGSNTATVNVSLQGSSGGSGTGSSGTGSSGTGSSGTGSSGTGSSGTDNSGTDNSGTDSDLADSGAVVAEAGGGGTVDWLYLLLLIVPIVLNNSRIQKTAKANWKL